MLKEQINDFLAYLETVKQLSNNTSNSYKRDLYKLSEFLSGSNIDSWKDVKESDIRSYANKERRRGLSPRSIQRILSSYRSFFNYLLQERIIDKSPVENISSPKSPNLLPRLWMLTWCKDCWILDLKECSK